MALSDRRRFDIASDYSPRLTDTSRAPPLPPSGPESAGPSLSDRGMWGEVGEA